MSITALPNELRDIASSLTAWEPREYDAHADYCRIAVYGQREPIVLTLEEFSQRESARWERHANRHVGRAGSLLSQAFAFGLFDDVDFFEIHTMWRWYRKQDSDCPAPHWWAQFFTKAAGRFHLMQADGTLNTGFAPSPWASNDASNLRFHRSERLQKWLDRSMRAAADLVMDRITPQLESRITSVPAYLLPVLERLSFDLLASSQVSTNNPLMIETDNHE